MNTEQLKTADKTLLDQIKDQVAEKEGYENWTECRFKVNSTSILLLMDQVAEMYATAKAKEINSAIGNLLAVIHGDGGHYQEKHGTLKAIEDAQELLYVKWKSLTQVKDSCEATLKKASENAKLIEFSPCTNFVCMKAIECDHPCEESEMKIDKSSITDHKNITIV